MDDKNLVFLISQPRSGSTLTQKLLSSHSRIYSTAEPWLMLHPLYALRTKGIQTDYDSGLAYNALQDVLALLPNGKQDYMAATKKFGLHIYGKLLQNRDEDLFLDKTPRYYKIISDLIETYPQARFIFLVRNPLAVLVSIYKTWIGSNTQLLSHHKDDITEAPQKLLKGIEIAGPRGYQLNYEELVASPESEIEKLCDFLNIDFEVDMLDYNRASVGKGKMGDPVKINQHSKAVNAYTDAWKKKTDNPVLAFLIQEYIKGSNPKIFQELGYSYLELLLQVQLQTQSVAEPPPAEKEFLRELTATTRGGILFNKPDLMERLETFEEELSPKIDKYTEEALLTWLEKNLPKSLSNKLIEMYLKALIKLYKGNSVEAKTLFESILNNDNCFFKAAVQLSFLYWSKNDTSKAVKYMRYARHIAPGHRQTLEPCLQMWEQLEMNDQIFHERCRYYAWEADDENNTNHLKQLISSRYNKEAANRLYEIFEQLNPEKAK